MKQKQITLTVILAAFCAIVWMGLPMSVWSEKHPVLDGILKVLGTISGCAALAILGTNYYKNNYKN